MPSHAAPNPAGCHRRRPRCARSPRDIRPTSSAFVHGPSQPARAWRASQAGAAQGAGRCTSLGGSPRPSRRIGRNGALPTCAAPRSRGGARARRHPRDAVGHRWTWVDHPTFASVGRCATSMRTQLGHEYSSRRTQSEENPGCGARRGGRTPHGVAWRPYCDLTTAGGFRKRSQKPHALVQLAACSGRTLRIPSIRFPVRRSSSQESSPCIATSPSPHSASSRRP